MQAPAGTFRLLLGYSPTSRRFFEGQLLAM